MKILVPTDFSIYAEYATEVAIELATRLGAELHFYHSADIPDDWEDLSAKERYLDNVNKTIAIRVGKKLDALSAKCDSKGIRTEVHYTGGRFLKNIHEVLDKIDFDLIVMGSHGATSKEEWFIGSKTQKVVRNFHVPTLVIKRPLSEINFKNIVFASEMSQRDEDGFRHFLQFLQPFKPEVLHLLMVNTSSFFNQPLILAKESLKSFEAIAKGFNCKSHFYSDYSIESGIRHFAEQHNINLIGISNIHSSPIKRIFQGSVVEMLVNHTEVPVYVVDYPNNKSI